MAVGAELREAISSGSEILGSMDGCSWGPQILLFYVSDLILQHVTNDLMASIHSLTLVSRHSLEHAFLLHSSLIPASSKPEVQGCASCFLST